MANEGIHKHTIKETSNLEIGQLGFDVCSAHVDSEIATVLGTFIAVYNPNDAEVNVSIGGNIGDTLTVEKIPSNGTIYGNFQSVRTMSPGKKLIAYRG
tara:strand:+ start:104 stop:397 length:294 start_codon:yes stop_codon:yes gene_type:complete